ncbi:MAG: hypothetical protein F4X11_22765 [Acidobacteria bacterium]|nr:hypothetical protein [Acidobacteriota bacterium]
MFEQFEGFAKVYSGCELTPSFPDSRLLPTNDNLERLVRPTHWSTPNGISKPASPSGFRLSLGALEHETVDAGVTRFVWLRIPSDPTLSPVARTYATAHEEESDACNQDQGTHLPARQTDPRLD